MDAALYQTYVRILHEELVPAMGCTEPIAIAYAGALARKTLERLPERIELTVSGNIIKNVKSVIVPHTGGRKGIPVAVAAGVRVGDADAQLEVLANVTQEQLPLLDDYLSAVEITVTKSPLRCPFDIQVRAHAGEETAFVQIVDSHTNVVRVERNGEVLLSKPFSEEAAQPDESRKLLTVENIIAFADEVDLDDVRAPIARQIEYNTAIAEAGLTGEYGAAVGKILLDSYGDSVQNRAKAWAAAGSDARMNGCEKPVIINSGSGNQGMTASLPVIVYAHELHASEEQLYRALVVSNLVTIHLKTGIGSLSAYCGATSAATGAACGIAYMLGGSYEDVCGIITNTITLSLGKLVVGLLPPLIFALAISECRNKYVARAIQTVSYLPHFLSWAVVYGICLTMLSESTGVINGLIKSFGGKTIPFLTSNKYFRGVLIGSDLWKNLGWGAITYIAAIMGVDTTLYEAATVDGCGRFRQIWYITLPCIRKIFVVLLILNVGKVLDAGFNQVYVFLSDEVRSSGEIIDTWVYTQGIGKMNYSLSTAVGLMKSVLSCVLVFGTNALARKWDSAIW